MTGRVRMPSLDNIIRTGGGKETGVLATCYKQLHENTIVPAAWRLQAGAFLAQGDVDRCRLVLETLLHAVPQDVAAHLMLGDVALRSGPGSCDEAVATCRHAHNLAADQDSTIQSHTAAALGVALATKARVPSITPDHRTELREAALETMQGCLGACPQERLTATLHYNLAVTSAELGLLPQALRHAHAALAAAQNLSADAEPLLVSCVLLVALLMTARRQLQEGLAVLGVLDRPRTGGTGGAGTIHSRMTAQQQVRQLQEGLAVLGVLDRPRAGGTGGAGTIHSRMTAQQQVLCARIHAGILAAQGDYPAAVAVLTHCRKALAAHATRTAANAQVWQELAMACAKAGACADACYCADQALQLEPWSAGSHSAGGCAHEAAGRYSNAVDSYSTALALDPHHAHSLLRQGVLLAKAGTLTQLSAARDLISEALRLEPSNPMAWYQLGLACKAMQHAGAAEKHLRMAMQLAASAPVLPFAELPLSFPPEAANS